MRIQYLCLVLRERASKTAQELANQLDFSLQFFLLYNTIMQEDNFSAHDNTMVAESRSGILGGMDPDPKL
jgi:hypothetical protein